jgi:hypothetical protein
MPGCAPDLAQNSSSKSFGLSLNIPVQDRKYPSSESESKHVFNACQFSGNAQTLNSRFLAAPFGLDSTARRWVCERGMI